ncbi:MAG TPA: glucose 1-dehydrogenase [Thermomicrobiales bacterium]|jgi:3-oxoacyl-[acyl-carrier protein] reductase|nr:glucose 1-dehydrogenase [Thermomicrobiales bacterium]
MSETTSNRLAAANGASLGLEGKSVLVTGGGSGIGRGIAEAFGQAGAKVALTYRESADGANEVVAAIADRGGEAMAMAADLTGEAEVARVFDAVVDRFGTLDALVTNSGGLLQRSRIVDCPLDLWHQAIAVNLTSTFLCCRAALKIMEPARSGAIVTISSLAALNGGGSGSAHYAATKGAVVTFTRALAKDVGGLGIRVNSVAPGLIGTQFHDRFSTPEGRAKTVARTPLGREGTPRDVAGVVLFLASPLAAFVTGETIEVSGGQSLA